MPATTPEQVQSLFRENFNAGDIEALVDLYETDAVLIPAPGAVARGRQEVRAALEEFLGMKGTLAFETKVAVATGDLAYLAGTWQLSGKDPDGNDLTMGATTAEVVRRQSDGTWRYVLDNAWGDQAAAG
jgi:uncharacterized protein (TIGR02246 family)